MADTVQAKDVQVGQEIEIHRGWGVWEWAPVTDRRWDARGRYSIEYRGVWHLYSPDEVVDVRWPEDKKTDNPTCV